MDQQIKKYKSSHTQMQKWKNNQRRFNRKLRTYEIAKNKGKDPAKVEKFRLAAQSCRGVCEGEGDSIEKCLSRLNNDGIVACCEILSVLADFSGIFQKTITPLFLQLNRDVHGLHKLATDGRIPIPVRRSHALSYARDATLSQLDIPVYQTTERASSSSVYGETRRPHSDYASANYSWFSGESAESEKSFESDEESSLPHSFENDFAKPLRSVSVAEMPRVTVIKNYQSRIQSADVVRGGEAGTESHATNFARPMSARIVTLNKELRDRTRQFSAISSIDSNHNIDVDYQSTIEHTDSSKRLTKPILTWRSQGITIVNEFDGKTEKIITLSKPELNKEPRVRIHLEREFLRKTPTNFSDSEISYS